MMPIGAKKIVVDGEDISRKVRAVRIELAAGTITTVEIGLLVKSVEMDADGNITVNTFV